MFEKLIERQRLVSVIGAKIVDDTEDFTISVSLPPPPEGKAVIISIESPSSFTPNVPFTVLVRIMNDGGNDWMFARLINSDTGSVIKEGRREVTGGGGVWAWEISVTLPQETDFHGRVEAGHET